MTLTFDLLTLKVVTESHCEVGYLYANYSLPRPLCSHTEGGEGRGDIVAAARLQLVLTRLHSTEDHSPVLRPVSQSCQRTLVGQKQTWLRTAEGDLRSFNLGLASACRRAQNRTAWRRLVETATSMISSK